KRAQYWLGSREDVETYGEDDDDETMVYEDPDEDEVDIDSDEAAWDGVREELEDGNYGYEDDDEDEFVSTSWTARRQPRALSEGVMEGIEL
ncbi:RNA polymerase III-inhibiting protein maf1, partial [Elasticomyces elasticus]